MDGLEQALTSAKHWARRLGDGTIRSEHLLLAVAEDQKSPAGETLSGLGITPDNVLVAVLNRAAGGSPAGGRVEDGFAPCARDALTLAKSEAARRGGKADEIDVLVGLRRGQGLASYALQDLGVWVADIRVAAGRSREAEASAEKLADGAAAATAAAKTREMRAVMAEVAAAERAKRPGTPANGGAPDPADKFYAAIEAIERRLRSLERAITGQA